MASNVFAERRRFSERDLFVVQNVEPLHRPESNAAKAKFSLVMIANLKGRDTTLGDDGEFPIKFRTWERVSHVGEGKVIKGNLELLNLAEFLVFVKSRGYELAVVIKKPLEGDSYPIKDFMQDLSHSPVYVVVEASYESNNGAKKAWREDLSKISPDKDVGRILSVSMKRPGDFNNPPIEQKLVMIELRPKIENIPPRPAQKQMEMPPFIAEYRKIPP